MPATWPSTSCTPFSSGSARGHAGSTRKLGASPTVEEGFCAHAATANARTTGKFFTRPPGPMLNPPGKTCDRRNRRPQGVARRLLAARARRGRRGRRGRGTARRRLVGRAFALLPARAATGRLHRGAAARGGRRALRRAARAACAGLLAMAAGEREGQGCGDDHQYFHGSSLGKGIPDAANIRPAAFPQYHAWAMKITSIDTCLLSVPTPKPMALQYPEHNLVVAELLTDEGVRGLGYSLVFNGGGAEAVLAYLDTRLKPALIGE